MIPDGRTWATGGDWPLIVRSQFDALRSRMVGSPTGLLLCGPAGVGKTQLAMALRDATTLPVAAFACSPSDADIPLTAVNRLLAGRGGLLPDSREAAEQRAREHLAEIGDGRTVLLLGDDVQWIDDASAELIAALVRSGDAQLLATTRSARGLAWPLARLLHDDLLRRVDVEGLSVDDVVAMLEQLLGGPVDHDVADQLVRSTGGNALFVREAVRSALADGHLTLRKGVWTTADWRLPTGTALADLVDSELDRVDPDHRPVLELVALSQPIRAAEVVAALGVEARESIDAFIDAGLVVTEVQPEGTVLRISHPVHAERIRRRTPAKRRRALHEQRYADADVTTMAPGDFLRWVDWAVETGLPIAPDQLLRAAYSASALGQDRFALRMAESAVARLDEDAVLQRADALLLCAWQRLNLAAWQEGLTHADALIELLTNAEVDPIEAALRLYGGYRVRGDVQQFVLDDVDAALATMDDYLTIEGAALFHDRAVGRARRLSWAGDATELMAFLPRLEADGDPLSPELLELVPPAITQLTWRGEIDRGLRLSAQHWEGAQAAKTYLPWVIAELHTATAHAYLLAGRLTELEEGDWLVLEGDVRQDHSVTRMGQAHFDAVQGRWQQAWSQMQAAVAHYEARDPSGLLHWAAAAAADIAVMAGKWTDAARLLEIVETGATRISRGTEGDSRIRAARAAWGLGWPVPPSGPVTSRSGPRNATTHSYASTPSTCWPWPTTSCCGVTSRRHRRSRRVGAMRR
jgi:hypothetical protein